MLLKLTLELFQQGGKQTQREETEITTTLKGKVMMFCKSIN
jgi:hypothetical protein